MKQICKNCGIIGVNHLFETYTCKKFEAVGEQMASNGTQKGCGKVVLQVGKKKWKCGDSRFQLCKNCKPQNHSPSGFKLPCSSLLNKGRKDTPRGKVSIHSLHGAFKELWC